MVGAAGAASGVGTRVQFTVAEVPAGQRARAVHGGEVGQLRGGDAKDIGGDISGRVGDGELDEHIGQWGGFPVAEFQGGVEGLPAHDGASRSNSSVTVPQTPPLPPAVARYWRVLM